MDIGNENDNFVNGDASSDYDSDVDEINSLFSPCPQLYSQSVGPVYILDISATRETTPCVAAALSDYSCAVFDLSGSQVSKVSQFKEHTNKLINCRFSPENNNLLYTASNDGTIKLWDLRGTKGSVVTFKDTTLDASSLVKPLSSFDVSPCNRLLAAGTDLNGGDAYILFWDVRNTQLLGAYWESHTDDITQVKFHPENSNKLMSGSTDGLINIYNLLESSEEDALQECLNTEALVEDLQWFDENNSWKISCVTSTHDLQLWKTDGAEPYKQFKREEIASNIKRNIDNVFVAKVHPIKNSLLLISGSNGRSLRSLQISNGTISPAFYSNQNTQRVRATWVNEHTNLLLTGGEKGILDVWNPDLSVITFSKRK